MPYLSGSLTGNSGNIFPNISTATTLNNSSTTTTNLQVHNAFYATGATPVGAIQTAATTGGGVPLKLAVSGSDPNSFVAAAAATPGQSFYFAPLSTSVAVSLSTATTSGVVTQPIKFQTTAHAEVSQVS